MRILLVNYEYPPLGGGGGIETRDLAEELAKTHAVHVITTGYGDLPEREVRNGVHVHRVRVWGRTHHPTATIRSMITFVPAALGRGVRVVREFRPEVINAHFVVPSGVPAVMLARVFRIPLILTLIGGDIFDPTKGISPHRHAFLRWVIRAIVSRATALASISRDTKERAMRYHGAPSNIQVIPLGLVPVKFQPRSREDLGWNPAMFHFITIGRLIPRKGYQDLLRGFAATTHQHAVLHVVGDGPQATDLKRERDRLGLSDRVQFHGWVSDEEKFQLLNAADAYVSASVHEGFGIVFLEAMFVGVPIIATDTGGQTDFLVAGRNAILIPPNRPEQMAHAMDWLMEDEKLRTVMRNANTSDVQRYMIGSTARQYEDLFARARARVSAR